MPAGTGLITSALLLPGPRAGRARSSPVQEEIAGCRTSEVTAGRAVRRDQPAALPSCSPGSPCSCAAIIERNGPPITSETWLTAAGSVGGKGMGRRRDHRIETETLIYRGKVSIPLKPCERRLPPRTGGESVTFQ